MLNLPCTLEVVKYLSFFQLHLFAQEKVFKKVEESAKSGFLITKHAFSLWSTTFA